MYRDITEIISKLTLEEKASLCSGLDFWHTKAIHRLGIPSIMVTDGPHGLRKQLEVADHIGINESIPATCFPTGAALACSWDRKLMEKIGSALGEECQKEGVSIILGPAVNIKRSPLCGRNFEYFSEDPYLSSEMAASHIKGVQSQGVGTSLKHFAVNNQEHRRLSIDAIVDERTIREIYLASFEGAVKQGKPWTVMCSYNKVNGTYCSENEYLLTSILKQEWGHKGFVMSDWGAVDERTAALSAGLELEMPSSGGAGDRKIVEAVKKGKLSEIELDKAVERLLNIIFKAWDNRKPGVNYDVEEHHSLARKAAGECMVLLKNENSILPLKKEGTIAIIGGFAKKPRYQGGGSSHINPTKLDNVLDILNSSSKTNIIYAEGFNIDTDDVDCKLLDEAKAAAIKAETAIIFAGLPDRYESEGYDRKHLRIPYNQTALIEAITEVQRNVVVVLSNGSPIEMPWVENVKGILEGYLGGQASAGAMIDILFGDTNPSGKLAETFPQKLSDNPSYLNFPGEGDKVEYREGVFVGYRYYDKKEIKPLFPFGFGLSYTNFEYEHLSVDKTELKNTEAVKVTVYVKNTGKVAGKEIVQLYVRPLNSSVIRPDKELKDFEKIELKPGEEKKVTFTLYERSFAYYNTELKQWYAESGNYELLIGGSSKDLPLTAVVSIKNVNPIKKNFSRNSTLADIMAFPEGTAIVQQLLKTMFGDSEDPIAAFGAEPAEMIKGMVLRSIVAFSGGAFTEEMLNALLEKINNKNNK